MECDELDSFFKKLNNENRNKMLFKRDRRLIDLFDPYTPNQLVETYKLYIENQDNINMSITECRLIETIIDAWIDLYKANKKLKLLR
ncbi:MAG: hypothetical protein ACTSX6_08220 [Candidatus Heimdallarchaeaceae archaeon]